MVVDLLQIRIDGQPLYPKTSTTSSSAWVFGLKVDSVVFNQFIIKHAGAPPRMRAIQVLSPDERSNNSENK